MPVQHPQTVRRLALLGFLGAALLVQSAGATSVAPQSLVLRQSDVPASYRLNPDKSGRRTSAQDSVGYPGLRTKYASWGRLGGYQNQFDKGDDSIASRADVFHGRSGARRMLAWFVAETERQGVLHLHASKVPLGDEGVEYSFAGGDVAFTHRPLALPARLLDRRRGRARACTRAGLARTQQRRVASALR